MLSIFSQLIFGNSRLFGGNSNGLNNSSRPNGNNSSSGFSLGQTRKSFGAVSGGSGLANSLTGSGGGSGSESLSSGSWKDRSICFDLRQSDLELDYGEQLIACYFPIEDIKGNEEEFGVLKVTNLRLIWICCDKRKINLSIGWRAVTFAFEQNLKDSLGSSMPSLCVLTRFESSKYEFVFNKMPLESASIWLENYRNNNDPRNPSTSQEYQQSKLTSQYLSKLDRFFRRTQGGSSYNAIETLMSHVTPSHLAEPFDVVFRVWQAYKRTHLFRHCRSNLNHLLLNYQPSNVNGSSKTGGADQTQRNTIQSSYQKCGFKLSDLNKLPSEDVIDIYAGIQQVQSRSLRYTGTLILSNIRLIWIDETMPPRNLSIPYIKIDSIKFKQSDRIVVNTLDYIATSDHVEFRMLRQQLQSRPESQLQQIASLSASGNQTKELRQIYDQIQDLFNLYRSVPRFGPESCEECINFTSFLKPIEEVFDVLSIKGPVLADVSMLENLGPEPKIPSAQDETIDKSSSYNQNKMSSNYQREVDDDDDELESQSESQLNRYNLKVSSYLNDERPPEAFAVQLIYSEEFGLMVEKPANNQDLARIWAIEVQ